MNIVSLWYFSITSVQNVEKGKERTEKLKEDEYFTLNHK